MQTISLQQDSFDEDPDYQELPEDLFSKFTKRMHTKFILVQ